MLGTGASYALQAADVGKTVTVTASYTDGGGTAESKTSVASPTVGVVKNGTANADTLTGTAGNDSLNGLGGNDSLDGGLGADKLTGGDGNDVYYVDHVGDVVTETNAVSATGGLDSVYSSLAAYTLGANVENLRILSAGAANGTGNALSNVIWAGAGNNVMDGVAGFDAVSYSYATAGVTANLSLATAQATGGSGSDTLLNIENLAGSAFNDTLTGNGGNNYLSGGAGNDSLNGGAGADTMVGGDGNDIYYVDNAGDVVSETNAVSATGGLDSVYSTLAAYTLGANVENLRLLSAGAANGVGNALSNVIWAGAGNNVIDGAAGNDTVSYAFATAGVSVSLALTTAQATGGSGSDTLLNIENFSGSNFNDTLTGNGGNNTLLGNSGNDTLSGDAGNDTLIGGAGKDTQSGGLGADTFKYGAVSDSDITAALRDVIQDFSTAQGDKIDLSALDANSAVAADQAFSVFAQGAVFSGSFAAQASLFLDQTAQVLYGNNDADAQADFSIGLVGVSSLALTDFVA